MRLRFVCLFLACFWPCAAFSAPPVLSSVETYLERVEPIRAQVEAILADVGVPVYFLFLALAESGGDQRNVSPAGAGGLWQLMPATARAYGIAPAERFDVEKSTRAAARYIRHLLNVFNGDYLWTIAAYNAGGHNLRKATGYKKGMSFEAVKTARPAAYALARTVQRMEARYGRKG